MMKQGEWPPLMVVFDPKEGFTVEADVFIRDWTIITEYAGDVDYLKNREADDGDSMMTLLSTNDPSKDLVICPDKHSNIARFINGINNHTPPQLHGLCKSWKLLQPATSGSIFKVLHVAAVAGAVLCCCCCVAPANC